MGAVSIEYSSYRNPQRRARRTSFPFFVLTILSSDSLDSIAIIKRLADEKLIAASNAACLIEKFLSMDRRILLRVIELTAVLVFLVLTLFMVYCFFEYKFF
ncbi:hypothetical protein CDIK_1091 [Cucumispora dikerogammari]|nr:hypothetical protein CDIK_1091 [Cucumispora dikerogammari]